MNPKVAKKIRIVLVFVLLIAAAIGVAALLAFSGLMNKVNHVSRTTSNYVPPAEETFEVTTTEPDTVQPEEVIFDVDSIGMMDHDDIKNLLLIGQDRREGEGRQRSDSIIVCSINTKENKVTLVSLMRDMYVPIPGYSANRINAAYAFGGMELLDNTIQQDFGIPIDGNIEVDFDGFMNALDVIGNIEMELTEEEAEYLNAGDWFDMDFDDSVAWELKEGLNELTPPQALAFSRIRHVGNSDWERTDRQRRVIMAAFSAIGNSSTAKMLKAADEVFPYITTDLSNSDLLSYVKTISVAGITNLESYRLPAEGHYSAQTINGMSVLVPDLVMNSQILKSYLYGSDVDENLVTENYVPDLTASPEPAYEGTVTTQTTTYTEPVFYEPEPAPAETETTTYTETTETTYTETYEEQNTGTDQQTVSDDYAAENPDVAGTDAGGAEYSEPVSEEPVYVEPVAEEPVYVEPAAEPPAETVDTGGEEG